MKACVIQPYYSADYALCDKCFEPYIEMMEKCDESMDLIVLPEASNVPCLAHTKEEFHACIDKYTDRLLKVASETAKRCNAVLFVNAAIYVDGKLRNTTIAYNRQGEVAGHYYKQHLTPGEVFKRKMDSDYSFEFSQPTVIEIDGIRYGFLVCYDYYFYEAFANMARQKMDVIIGCSHQRTDTHAALEIMSRMLAYNTNAWVVRSSVSMGEESPVGGGSCVVKPDGTVLLDMKSEIGMACTEIEPHQKYYKPAGFGNPEKAHYEYIEEGRRPWKYRPAGSAIVRHDQIMPYPRVCAHRGFNSVAPENSLPAFGAAVALGAEEIEFDLWMTKDGVIVSIHDPTLDRVSTGTGKVWEHTYEELLQYDFGCKRGEEFKGLKIITFEEILKKFSCHVVMNIHIKTQDNVNPCDEEMLKKILALIDKYDCKKYCYFMSGNDIVHHQLKALDPEAMCCMGGGDRDKRWLIVDRAIAAGCRKVQLFKPYFDKSMVEKAHAHGILCNVFWSDDPKETEEFLDMGIDTILTNDYLRISQVVAAWKKKHGK